MSNDRTTWCSQTQVWRNGVRYHHDLENDARSWEHLKATLILSKRKEGNIPKDILVDIQQRAADIRHLEICPDPFIGKGKYAKRTRAKILRSCFRCARWNCRQGMRTYNNGHSRKPCDWGNGIPSGNRPLSLELINHGADAIKETRDKVTYCGMCAKKWCGSCSRFDEQELSDGDYGLFSDDEPDPEM